MGFWSTLNYGTSLLPSSSIPPLIFINGSLSLRYLFYQISLRNFFVGSITFEPWKRLWKSWAPSKCNIFFWLAIRNRHWTADRLQERGLPHSERCPLCDQDTENIQHILRSCLFARQLWFAILKSRNLTHLIPSSSIASFAECWRGSWKKLQKQHRKGFNPLCILRAWILWKHRSACVYDGMSPNLQRAHQAIKEESLLWRFSVAKGLASLDLGRLVEQV